MAHKFLSYLSSPATSALFRRRKSAAPATSALFRRRKSAAPATSALFRRISAAPATSALFRHKSAAPAISDIIQRKSKSAPPTSSVFGRRATDTASRSRSIGYRRIEVHLNFWSLPASLRSAVYSRIGLDLNLWNNLASSRLADNIGSNYRYYGGGRFTHGRHMKGGRKSRTRKQKKPASDPPTHTCPVCLDKFHTSAALRQHQRAKNHYSGPINETNNTENVVKSEVRNETSGFVSTEVPEKINETKDVMKRKANEIDKSKIEKSRGEKGGYMSLQSMGSRRIDSGFGSDTSTAIHGSGGLGIGPGFGLNSEVESFSSKPKGRPPASAAAPSKGGMQLGKIQRTNQFLESLKAEGEVIVEDVRPSVGQSSVAAPPPTDPVTLTVDEKLNVTLKQDGGIGSFDLQGTLSLQILNQDDGHIQVQIESGGNPGIIFKTHPNINKDLFSGKNILGSKDPNRPFPANQTGDGLPVLKWRMQSSDESLVPLSINCWPSVSGNETYVNLEYEASPKFGLQNVVISIPLPALREAPKVQQIDGEWRYNSRKSILEWSIVLIDNSNISGFMEFVIPAIDTSDLFPISVRFSSTSTFSGLKVANIVPLKGGNAPKFSQRTLLSTDNYQVA